MKTTALAAEGEVEIKTKPPFVERWLITLTIIGAIAGVVTGIIGNAAVSNASAVAQANTATIIGWPGRLWVCAR